MTSLGEIVAAVEMKWNLKMGEKHTKLLHYDNRGDTARVLLIWLKFTSYFTGVEIEKLDCKIIEKLELGLLITEKG